jgi:hypothetical protein
MGTAATHDDVRLGTPRTGDDRERHQELGRDAARNPARFRTPRRLTAALTLVALVTLAAVLPAAASAFATLEGPPQFSAASGLPDGRVYEQVSPASKNGNSAGAPSSPAATGGHNHYGYSSPDGDAVLFEGTGPMGESPWGNSLWFVATKNTGATGWSTRALMPRAVKNETLLETKIRLTYLAPSQDLSHAVVDSEGLGQQTNEKCEDPLWLTGSDPFVAGTWLGRPSPELVNPVESCGSRGISGAPIGGTPNFSTVYFTIPGTLLPQDASRAPHAVIDSQELGEAWGLYEYTEGVPREAGVLPDGSLSPFGAVPAASGHGRNPDGNQVSENGSRLFFVSPDPASCEENGGHNDCATDPPELYVHETGQERAQLISRDTLLGEPAGSPVAAPGGISKMANESFQYAGSFGVSNSAPVVGSYVFASPDGSQAFFQSTEALTQAAAEYSPGAERKTYDFDVNTGSLTFLPGVQGEILAVDSDGSDMAFMTAEDGGQPAQLNLWSAGPAGGTATPVVQLPEANASVPESRISAEGSVLVFQTAERLSSSFNSGGFEQIYRYDIPANTLGCVSCAPAGVTPRGNAEMSGLLTDEARTLAPFFHEGAVVPIDQRGISSDGERIFFDSPDPLVPQDTNTDSPEIDEDENNFRPQGRDVYEWENGVVYLISTGQSPRNSYLLDSSENGDDVFFATAQGLVPADTDGGYDIYDARIPQPGDNPPPASIPCGGSACQGDANTGPSVTPPASASFFGVGNLVPEVTPTPAVSSTPKAVKCKKGFVKKRNKCVKSKARKKAKKISNAEKTSTDRRVAR